MYNYRDKILIEIAGHDHLADLRTHSVNELWSNTDECMVFVPN